MSNNDPICDVCGSRRSEHVKTTAGPFTHPKEARGEGIYTKAGTTNTGHPYYRFISTAEMKLKRVYGPRRKPEGAKTPSR